MIFDLSDEQRELRDAVAELCERSAAPERVAQHADGDDVAPVIWAQLAEMGVQAAAVDEQHGGLGLPSEVLGPILEVAGRHALPVPLLDTLAVGLPVLALADDPGLRAEWLPRLAEGALRVAVRYSPGEPIAYAENADVLLQRDAEGWTLTPAPALEVEPLPSIDQWRPLSRVNSPDVDAVRVELSPASLATVESSIEVGVASFLIGVAARLLEMTTSYATQREQFGRPIGSFQAVKHKLADIWMAVETARSASWYAGHLVSVGDDARELPSAVARIAAVRAARLAVRDALQLHGAIGFTWEYPLHVWLKQGRSLELAFGGERASVSRLQQIAVPAP